MRKLTFTGGVHPYDGKDLSKDKPIISVLPKGELVYPVSQHIGAPATPIVKKGTGYWWDRRLRSSQVLCRPLSMPPYQAR